MDPLFQQLASTGVVGLVAAIFLYLYVQERRDHNQSAKEWTSLAMALQKEVITAVSKLSDIVEAWEKQRDEERKREEAARDRRRGP